MAGKDRIVGARVRRPFISVIVPVRNGSDFLEGAIESVLAQTDPDWELVIGDNASTDGTRDVAAAHNDDRIRYVLWDEPADIFDNFNRTFGLAHGEWVYLLPADDRLAPECLARIRAVVEGHHGQRPLVAVRVRAARVDPSGHPIDVAFYGMQGVAKVPAGVYDAAGWLAAVCAPGSPPWDGGAFRRATVEAMGTFFRSDIPTMSADYELSVRIATLGDVAYVDEVLLEVTGFPGSHTPGRLRRNLQLGEDFTSDGIAFVEGLRAHENARTVSPAERRAVARAVARTYLRRATAHRTYDGGRGRSAAVSDVVRAFRLSPRTVARSLPVAVATIVLPASVLMRLRSAALRRRERRSEPS
jgi:glycosyltransferase involved in cell wall biosynthesis